jgi:hypothetical protein
MGRQLSEAERLAIEYINQNEGSAFSRKDIASAKDLPALSKFLLKTAEQFITEAVDKLESQGRVNTGNLSKNLSFTEETNGNVTTLTIGYPQGSPESEYGSYVDEGVMGFVSKRPASRFFFKSKRAGSKMANAIFLWLENSKKLTMKETARTSKTPYQRRRRKISKTANLLSKKKSFAYMVASSIKQKGIKRSGYLTDTVKSVLGSEFQQSIAKIVSAEIQIRINEWQSQ